MDQRRQTPTDTEWLNIIATIKRDPQARWRVVGDDGFERSGVITNWPQGQPQKWGPDAKIHIGDVPRLPGEPVRVADVRRIERL